MTKLIEPPDMDTVFEVIDKIKELSLDKMNKEIEIDKDVARIYKRVKTDNTYFESGKPPAVSFVQKTYEFTGLEGELVQKRKDLAELTSNLEHAKLLLNAYKNVLEIWRTESANSRKMVN